MKITVLIENRTNDESLAAEHGLSLYIETARGTILFDTGQSGKFADNADRLGIGLERVDFAVLSHGHYDHGGGLFRFLERNRHAEVYVNENAFRRHLNRKGEYIGLDPRLRESGRLVLTGDEYAIRDGVSLYTCDGADLKYPIDSAGLSAESDGRIVPDTFRHEHYLLIEEEGKRYLISGCSHKGILNLAARFEPDVLVGGFHFKDVKTDREGRDRLTQAARELLSHRTVYYTGHCTGAEQFDLMKKIMGDRLEYISTGSRLVF